MNLDQAQLPLVSALAAAARRPDAAFHTPGHKRGQSAPADLVDLLGKLVFQADLPELPDLDNLFAPEGAIAQAQLLAAAAFGAEQTWFLANGSTSGIEAAVLATCNPGDRLILPRNVHQSAIAALILAGAVPIFVLPEYDPDWDIAHPPTPAAIEQVLHNHPDAKAVLIVSPTYHGVCADVKAIAQRVHQFNLPLLVDEAHGAHFAFHPDLPPAALAMGADLAVQSTHKTLSAFTQAAMLHMQGVRIDRARLAAALRLVQSTSPSYLLLASLDAARQQMALHGQTLLDRTLKLANRAHRELSQIPGLRILHPTEVTNAIDRTRLTVGVANLGLTGFEADEQLLAMGVAAELPAMLHLTFILSIGTADREIDRLVQGWRQLASRLGTNPRLRLNLPPLPFAPLTPRDAFFAERESVSIAAAIDRISAEIVCPYPPGIPLLLPGEQITREAIDYLQQVIDAGGIVTGCDVDRGTVQVVKRSPVSLS